MLQAVLEPRKPGALQQIRKACEAGADPDAVCPETSTSAGYVRPGSTFLTHAIHEAASKVVTALLECGADPNKADDNGWTPWMASTLSDETKRQRIQDALLEHGGEKTGDHIGELVRAVALGDVAAAKALVRSEDDFKVLATFRVDLVGRQVHPSQPEMLDFLLEHGMSASSTNLLNAVRFDHADAVEVLMRHGVPPERDGDNETPLMTAASQGNRDIAELLIAAGADVNRYADDDVELNAAFYARQAGHDELADWLTTKMDAHAVAKQAEAAAGRDPRYLALYEQRTSGEGVSTDDIVDALKRWHGRYGVTVADADPASVRIAFDNLPDPVDKALLDEIIALGPEIDDREALLKALSSSSELMLWWD